MKLSRVKMIGGFFLAGVLSVPAWAAKTAQPGSLNYVEGQVAIGDQTVDAQAIGSIMLQPGQSLTTNNGKAEILLTPGVFLRLDDTSSVQMVAAGLTNTEVTLEQGRAMVEVTEIHPENNLRITEDGVSTQLLKTGLYDFDAGQNQVRVFSGKAAVLDGDREVTVDGGHEVDLNVPGKLKTEKFDKEQAQQSDLYRWSSLRSSYLAEANADAARVYVSNGYYGPGWVGAGWYWNSWYGSYTYIPAGGIFYSPFGWGFYSPLFVFRAPVFFVGHPFFHTFGPGFRSVVVARPVVTGGFRSGPVVAGRVVAHGTGGGFVRGSGGFHGGGGNHGRR
jgi:FecR protein